LQEEAAVAIDPQEAADGEKERESQIERGKRATAGRDQNPFQEDGWNEEYGGEPK